MTIAKAHGCRRRGCGEQAEAPGDRRPNSHVPPTQELRVEN